MKRLIVALAVALLCPLQGRADGLAEKERKLLEGVWSLTSVQEDGRTLPRGQFRESAPTTWIFKGDTVTLVAGDEKQQARYRVDPSKSPKELDLVIPTDRPGGGEEALLYIYERDGDHLRLCQPAVRTGGRSERPRSFKTDEGELILAFERAH